MASISASSSSKPLLPQLLQADDEPAAVEPARRKANTQKASIFPFLSRSRTKSSKKLKRVPSTEDAPRAISTSSTSPASSTKPPPADPLMAGVQVDVPAIPEPDTQIELQGFSTPLEDDSKDVYRWAVVYENQRGVTVFSVPYYSHLSLLPWDPPAFTLPDTYEVSHGKFYLSKSHRPAVSLSSYPLPNGDWKWVSKSWMIDMRSDGQVQYDGFEYNWFFRTHKWNATSAAWVRRRRWIRLMMRPAKSHLNSTTTGHMSSSTSPSPSTGGPVIRSQSPVPNNREPSRFSWRSGILSLPPSASSSRSATSSIAPGFIWQGDGRDDWERCHDYLRSLTRDGKKLEAWKLWLGLHRVVEDESEKEDVDGVNLNKQQWAEDEGLLPSQTLVTSPKVVDVTTTPPREWIVAAICEHMDEILQTFVYPDSRAQFVNVLRKIQDDLGEDAEKFLSSHQTEFWSYTFLNSGALASSVSMSLKEGDRRGQPLLVQDTDGPP
ncbi:hypothetical protein BJ322DRAFT_1020043 [Thelephora terrestris]|uniref:Peroxin domain-containing protein n=1 Tax=Thelephora terrestris TaxID=56493 RepID=A0A9P6HI11_9AGAM|nr:hypothetical protein BJ322DRAFT_1020043 [Thelephora terrestris]